VTVNEYGSWPEPAVSQAAIARFLGISQDTLAKDFYPELEAAMDDIARLANKPRAPDAVDSFNVWVESVCRRWNLSSRTPDIDEALCWLSVDAEVFETMFGCWLTYYKATGWNEAPDLGIWLRGRGYMLFPFTESRQR
jgi:hypothetical protein